MKALIAFVLMLVLVYFVAEIADEPILPAADSPDIIGQTGTQKIDLLSFQCPAQGQQYSAQITIRNLTADVFESVEAVVLLNPKGRMPFEERMAFTPEKLGPNDVAESNWAGLDRDGRDYECTLLRIEEIEGKRLDQ